MQHARIPSLAGIMVSDPHYKLATIANLPSSPKGSNFMKEGLGLFTGEEDGHGHESENEESDLKRVEEFLRNFAPMQDVERGRCLFPREEPKVYTVPEDLKEEELDAEISIEFDGDNDASYLDDLDKPAEAKTESHSRSSSVSSNIHHSSDSLPESELEH